MWQPVGRTAKVRSHVADQSRPIVFVHIPKTAGTTLQAIARRNCGDGFRLVPSYFHDPEGCLRGLDEIAREDRPPGFIQGHIPFELHPRLPEGSRLLTILRDPVERTLSHCYWRKAHRLRRLLADPAELERVVSEGQLVLDNLQTRMLSGLNPPFGECGDDLLEAARSNLHDRFEYVGVSEHFDEFLSMLAAALGWRDLLYSRERVNPRRPERGDLPPRAVRVIEEHNQLDLRLFEYAQRFFEKRRSRLGEDVEILAEAIARGNAEPERHRRPTLLGRRGSELDSREMLVSLWTELLQAEAELGSEAARRVEVEREAGAAHKRRAEAEGRAEELNREFKLLAKRYERLQERTVKALERTAESDRAVGDVRKDVTRLASKLGRVEETVGRIESRRIGRRVRRAVGRLKSG